MSLIRRFPLMVRFAAFILVPLTVVVWHQWRELQGSLPLIGGEIHVEGIGGLVTVTRDGRGIPQIRAETDADAFFAIGYAHAQDRLWQLELQRRLVRGELSEILGRKTVDQDVWMRTLGLWYRADDDRKHLSSQALESLEAYSNGIAAYLGEGHPLPVEFRVLGIEPKPWTVTDSLAWIKTFSLNLSGNFRSELRRLAAAKAIPPERLAHFFPYHGAAESGTGVADVELDRVSDLLARQQSLEQSMNLGGRYVGSNAWVVSGALSATGEPMLANDPHLALQMPSLWYAAAIEGDEINVSGMTIVGLPIVVFGANQRIAWGGTNLMADVQDLYVESLTHNRGEYWKDAQTLASLDRRESSIVVRPDFPASLRPGLNPVPVTVSQTARGPLIDQHFGLPTAPLALRWTTLLPGDHSYEAFLKLNYARDWSEFRDALSWLTAPALNLVYADREGNIGYQAAGKIPIRENGDGTLPSIGSDEVAQWRGFIPFDDLPTEFNPERGYVVSANNNPVDAAYPYFLSADWAPPTRAERIAERLEEVSRRGATVEDMRKIQLDTFNEDGLALVQVMMNMHEPADEHETRAYEILADWDGGMGRESQGATIFSFWVSSLAWQLYGDELESGWGEETDQALLDQIVSGVTPAQMLAAMTSDDGYWCDDKATADSIESCALIAGEALGPALWEAYKLMGDKTMNSWAWGRAQNAVYSHVPFSQLGVLAPFFERRIGHGGSPETVNVAAGGYAGSEGYVQNFGAGFRQLISLGAGSSTHLLMNSTGQSGNPLSDHFDDMVVPFADGHLVELGGGSASVLTMHPVGAGR